MKFIFYRCALLALLFVSATLPIFSQEVKTTQEVKASQSQAQEEQQQVSLEAIEVSTEAAQPVVKQSTPQQILRAEKMETLGMSELYEAVRTFSGVNITDYGGVGGVKTVSVRSLGAHHTAVSYDGVVVSNAQGGQVDIGSFTLDNIEEVSLTIGQGDEIFQSARSFESSGLLSIKSSKPSFDDRAVRLAAQVDAGSFGYLKTVLDLATKLSENWSIKAAGNWMKSDGDYPFTLVNYSLITDEIRNNSDVNTLRGEVDIYGTLGKKNGQLYIKGNLLESERGLPGSVILYNSTANERLWDKTRFVQAGYSVDLNEKWSLKSFAKYNYAWNKYADWDSKYQDGYTEEQYTQQEYYASGSVRFKPSREWSFSLAQDLFQNELVTTLSDCPDPYRISSLTALAGQYKNERLSATASLLGVYNHEWALNDTYEIAPDRQHLSPAVSASYKIFEDHEFRVRASVKDAYRVPTFNDLYYKSMGNTTLTPEQALQYNVGVTYAGSPFPSVVDYLTVSIDGYYNKVSNKIVAIPTMFIWKMMNLGEVDIRGVDANVSTYFTLLDALKLNIAGNYTYQRAIDVTSSSDKTYKHQIPYTAVHSGNAAITLQHKWFDLGYTATAVGDRYCLPQNIEANLIDGYVDQNLSISRKFDLKSCSVRLRAEVLNICDVNYDVIKYYPMPGRQYRLSVKFIY
ncbi:MAG: TonB-dependent receptor plug domain-containing protein [Rikenellaceae bacterium]